MVNFIILIILHLLGDFYLQTAKIAKCKNAKIDNDCNNCKKCKDKSKLNKQYMFIHMLLYTLPFVFLFFMTGWKSALLAIIGIIVSHGIIDSIACFFNKRTKQTLVFIIDQFLHTSILFLIYKMVEFNSIFDKYGLIVKSVLTVLLLMIPCSIFINKIFEDLYPETKNKGLFDVGSIIGILERFLVIIFAYFENFPAIAIIITVKTWARTNDLKEPEFRNKYLLGTLASLVLALCSYIIFKLV
ncbi:MAG: DUF3307 domain-containing protein [Ruminococcaceae bacterium]|nr:DUF3307 domain-containing protein [Oscillospiraceae bacterium]